MNTRLSLVLAVFMLPALFMPARAQDKTADSLRAVRDRMILQAALRFPFLRLAGIESEVDGNMHYTSKLHGRDFLLGTVQPNSLRGWTTLPVYTKGTQQISTTVSWLSQDMTLKNTVDKEPESPVGNGQYHLQTLSFSINYKRQDSLFHKRLISGGSLIASSSLQDPVDKVSGIMYGIVILKATRTTIISTGILVFINAAGLTPVLPTFSYWHKFPASPWEISIDLPAHALLRTNVFSKGLLSLGTELSDNTLFKTIDQPLLPPHIVYHDTDLKSGLTLEYPILKKVLAGCKFGMLNPILIRVLERSGSYNEYDILAHRNPGPYLSFSLALIP